MSIDLDFWRYQDGSSHDDAKVYKTACCDGETVEGLEMLPIQEILGKIAEKFSDWTALSPSDYKKEGRGAFQIFTTPQIVRFDCYGMRGEDMNALMDVLEAFGCPLYDPQISTRFDGWTEH